MVWSFSEKTAFSGGFTATDKKAILAAMQFAYDGSSTARNMFSNWIDAGKKIEINSVPNKFRAFLNTGKLELDLSWLTDNTYITPRGTAVEDTAVTAIVHELGHALTGRDDDGNNVTDYKGSNVIFVNTIYKQLGLPEQISYIAYDEDGSLHELGFDYTNGAEINKAFSGDTNFSSVAAGNSKDLLIGGPSDNILQSGPGDDFLWGAGSDDTLYGGFGTDTAGYKGKPSDYDIRLQPDGSWTSRHARGSKIEGNDKLVNIERVLFEGGKSYRLQKKGLTFQTDFALVIDTTGSMGSSIGAVKRQGTAIINALFADDTRDARIGIIGFKDTTNREPSSVILKFTDQDQFADRKNAALAALNSIGVGGGGDTPETPFDGLLKALNGKMGDWRPGAGVHRAVLFTDAPAKDGSLSATVASLAANIGATITSRSRAVGTSGSLDSFTLTPISYVASGRSLSVNLDARPLPPFEFTDESATPDTSFANLEIYTVYTGYFGSLDPDLQTIASTTGGSSFVAPNPDDLVKTLLAIINLPTNKPPTAADDVITTLQATPISIPVLANDSDPEGSPLKITGFDFLSAQGGVLGLFDNGTPAVFTDDHIVYTPAPGFTGSDTFNYTISDGKDEASASVSVTVKPSVKNPTYTLKSSAAELFEGDRLSVSIATNVPAGTPLYWSLSGAGITSSDFSDGMTTGTGAVGADGRYAFSTVIAVDPISDPNETLEIRFFSDADRSIQAGNTLAVTVKELSAGNPTDGSDIVQGTANDVSTREIISGVLTFSSLRGKQSVDFLTGLGGPDTFVLGDAMGTFYDDAIAAQKGSGDLGVILDFSSGDLIQLHGSPADYKLSRGAYTGGGLTNMRGLYIIQVTPGALDEVVGFIKGASLDTLSLTNTNQFIYA